MLPSLVKQTVFFEECAYVWRKGAEEKKDKYGPAKPARFFISVRANQIAAFALLNSSKSSTKFLRPLRHRNAGGLSTQNDAASHTL